MECPNSKTLMVEKYRAQVRPGIYEREYECPKDGEKLKTIEMPEGQYKYLMQTAKINERSKSRWRRISMTLGFLILGFFAWLVM